MSEAVQPFEIRVPEPVLVDLRERLARTRWVDPIAGVGWDYGLDVAFLRDLVRYWHDGFDWRREEQALNRFPQIVTAIEGLRVHAIHQRSPEPKALPLVITHGWPGSIAEFRKIVAPLADPVAHGGKREDAFHVVCPSIPGYGFSEAPKATGFDARAVARTIATLMERLGYTRYGAQGGDWGSMVSSHLALLHPERLVGLHLNMVLASRPPDEDPTKTLTPKELADLEAARRYMKTGTAYQAVQGLEPDLVAQALSDSPAGLAGWIVSKFRAWGDCDGDVLRRFTRDELLTNVTLYWISNSIASSMRLYLESRRAGYFGPSPGRVEVPTGCAIFPREIFRPPRRWVERLYNVVHWTEHAEGGHFAAMEVPELLVEDIRAFFRRLRS